MKPESFDAYAAGYDADFTYTPIGKAQRAQVWKAIQHSISTDKNILEINAGTGEDAVFLSSLGYHITATDASKAMLDVAMYKSKQLENAPEWIQLPMEDIATHFPEASFDVLFSNFGGINCLDEETLVSFFTAMNRVLKPEADIVLVIMGRKCLWERLYFGLKGLKSKANRRMQEGEVLANIPGAKLACYYYGPEEIMVLLQRHYRLKNVLPIGFFVPPSYLNPLFRKLPFLIPIFSFMDSLLPPGSFFANRADHYYLHMQRKV